MMSVARVVLPTDVAMSIEKTPRPSSYNRTEDTAGAVLPGRGTPGVAVERVIDALPAEACRTVLSGEDIAAAETSATGAANEIATGLFRSTGTGLACLWTNTISLRNCAD